MLSLSYYEKVEVSHNYERDGVSHKKYFMRHTVPLIIMRWSGWGVSYYETPHSFHKKNILWKRQHLSYYEKLQPSHNYEKVVVSHKKCVDDGQRDPIMNLWKEWGVSYYETPHSFHKKIILWKRQHIRFMRNFDLLIIMRRSEFLISVGGS